MKMKTVVFSVAALAANMAYAQTSADSVRDQLTNLGYANIEVVRNGDTYAVEAYRDGQKREITYNALTGEILSDRTSGNDNANTSRNDEGNDSRNDESSNDRNDESDDNGSDDRSDESDDDRSDDRSDESSDDRNDED